MKLVSWNVNGLRAVLGKNFLEVFNGLDADIFCLQETKCQQDQVSLDLPGYHQYFHSAERKGYSSTAVFSRKEPISIMLDFEDNGIHPREGRVMTLEYNSFYLVNAYVPNSKEQLARLDYRMLWEEDLLKHLNKLNESKPVIYCGDLNVAHEEIDIKNPAANHFSAGFSDQEREKMTQLLNSGYTDTFRWLYPDTVRYSWWSYRFNARANNAGWRIDYFIVSDRIRDKVTDSIIHDEITGSDHCPVELDIDI
ncbi:MAG: exodeoxyribonuclease III [Erysipelotrichaceae bacterium]|nr:exodeoxyribonuclease III [Erysipelotrichaceae bacterium]MBO4538415.1 exodeoxyribonuclease III [Erysipelotrichaceae bacterium]